MQFKDFLAAGILAADIRLRRGVLFLSVLAYACCADANATGILYLSILLTAG